jgi:hypothetical protein
MRNSDQCYVVRIVCCILVAMILLMLGGCSSLKVKESWHKPSGQIHQYKKLMILGIANDENRRKMFEDIVIDELRKRMVTAVASYTIVPDLDKSSREGIIAAVHAAGCDGVLTTRPISVGDSTVTQQGPTGNVGIVYGAAPMSSNYNFIKANLQANLFDAKTEELVWTATFKTFDANNEAILNREMGRFFYEILHRDGFL